jgi:uncharacterized membrane protein YfcA/tetratricopeptide (TPR) repeat protein
LPTSTAVEEKLGKQVLAELRGSLRELTKLLELPGDRVASARQEEPLEKTEERANAKVNLGLAYAQRVEGDRSQNWELAIAAFEDALSGLTRQHNPEEWAEAHLCLGVAYRDRLAGGRSDNQERAIRAFEDCLSVSTRERYPEQWAAARMNLGITYGERLAGDQLQNREQAIRAFEDSLSVWTAKHHPDDWATVQMNLGVAYCERGAGETWENQERAIAAFADALSVWSRETHAEQWAAARMNLGTLYWQRVAGHRSENRERAIAAFEDALSVLTRETNPEGWAAAEMNLGIAHHECAADEGSDSRDRAIEAFEEALSVWTRDSKPTAWAAARLQLGGAYLENSAGDRKENLERAIAALEDALSVLTREADPQEWAAAQMKLGIAYRERLAGNRSDNRDRAIAAFENALLVWTRERNPKEVTAARANLEAVCRDRFYEIMGSARGMFAGSIIADHSGAIGERETATTLEHEWIASIAVPTAALAIAGIAIAQRAVGDNAPALLRNGLAFVSTLHIDGGFTPAVAGAIAVVLFLAGVVSGLSGFAFSAVAACVLWLLPPLQAVPLIMLLSACNQLLSLGALRKEVVLRGTAEREGALAYIAGGIIGAPIGLGLLQTLPPRTFAGGLGLFLIVYSVLVLLKPHRLQIKVSGWKPAVAVGAAGGIIGGFSAFPGSMPVVYLGLRGVTKADTRGITQPYILALQLTSLGILALTHSAIFNAQFWSLWVLTLPAVLFGSSAGVALYRRISEVNFCRAVLILLIVSGVSLLAKTLM